LEKEQQNLPSLKSLYWRSSNDQIKELSEYREIENVEDASRQDIIEALLKWDEDNEELAGKGISVTEDGEAYIDIDFIPEMDRDLAEEIEAVGIDPEDVIEFEAAPKPSKINIPITRAKGVRLKSSKPKEKKFFRVLFHRQEGQTKYVYLGCNDSDVYLPRERPCKLPIEFLGVIRSAAVIRTEERRRPDGRVDRVEVRIPSLSYEILPDID